MRLLGGVLAGLLIVCGAGIVLRLSSAHSDAPLTVPTLPELDSIEPQVRQYVLSHINWVQEDPHDAHRQATLGLVYLANMFWPQALEAFQNAVRLDPVEPHAHLYVAIVNGMMGRSEGALRLYRRLIARFPEFAPAHYHLGEALLRSGGLDEAESAFETLIALAPAEWRGYVGLGTTKHRKNELAEAVQHFKMALRVNPDAKIAHHRLGLAYRRLGLTAQSERETRLGLGAEKTYPMPDEWSVRIPYHRKSLNDQLRLAQAYVSMGNAAKSVEVMERLAAWHPENTNVLNNLGVAYYHAGRVEDARDIHRKVTRIDPSNWLAYAKLATPCLRLGLADEAMDCADRAIELAPSSAQPYMVKAHVLRFMKKDLEALPVLQEAIRRDPKNPEIEMKAGEVCMSLDRPDKAKLYFTNATRKNADMVEGHIRLAEALMLLGEFAEAADAIEAARSLAPDHPELPALERQWRSLTARSGP